MFGTFGSFRNDYARTFVIELIRLAAAVSPANRSPKEHFAL